jgi:zinc protease
MELSEWAGAGDWRLMFLFRDRVAKVTAADVNRVAAQYLKQSNRTTGMFIPTKDPDRTIVPQTSEADLIAAVKDYKGGKGIDQGEAFDPTPANIEMRVKRLQLASGIKVAILPKKTRGQSSVGELMLHFGNEKSLNGLTTACSFVGPLMQLGTTKYSRQEITDLLDKYGATLNISSGTGSLSVSWKSKRDQLGDLLDLLEEILRRPTFPEKEFDEMRNSYRQALEKELTEPESLASNALTRKLNPYPKTDIRYSPTIQEGIERLDKTTRADVVNIYKEQLGGGEGELVLVGDFDVDSTLKRLEAIFAGWTTKVPFERIGREANTKVAGGTENILTPDKKSATFAAAMVFPMKDTAPDYPALLLGNYLLGGNFSSRLVDKLREKEGLCYQVGSHFGADALNPYAKFSMEATCNPESINKVDQEAMDELIAILTKGITAEELAGGKKGYLASKEEGRGNDSSLASMLRTGLYLGRTFEHQAKLEAKVAALTVEDVNRALATHLQASRLVVIRAGDFNKKAAPEPKK